MHRTPTSPRAVRLASSQRAGRPNHHLVNNNGTWWCQLTVHDGPASRRLRFSLRTRTVEQARERRDRVFASLATANPESPDPS